MKELGVRRRLIVISVAMIAVAELIAGLYLQSAIRRYLDEVCVSATPADIERVLSHFRLLLLILGLFGLLTAVVMSNLAFHLLSGAFRRLVETARSIALGEVKPEEAVHDVDDRKFSGSVQQMAAQMEHTVADLAGERDRLETVLESMSEAVIALDSEERVTLINQAAIVMLDLKVPVLGRPLVEAIRVPRLHRIAKDGMVSPVSDEFDLVTPKSRQVWVRVSPLKSTGGCVLVIHDMTEMRRLETIRRDLVANVSHELRTPVSIIRANAETLLDGAIDDPPAARVFLEALVRHSDRLSRILTDLLDLSRVEAGRYPLDLKNIPLSESIQRAVEVVEKSAREKRIAIQVEALDPPYAMADQTAVDQVLVNLLENAVKYTPEGGQVIVRTRRDGSEVRLEVRDNGPGIDPRHRGRIFERFYRVDSGRARDMGGTGLGLAIVKHLAEAMGGHAGMEPAHPQGSIFWITLPMSATADEK